MLGLIRQTLSNSGSLLAQLVERVTSIKMFPKNYDEVSRSSRLEGIRYQNQLIICFCQF